METSDLYRLSIEAIGAKKVAAALGLSLSHTYRLQRAPMDESDPDGTGARSDADRVESLMDVLAAHPDARPVLHFWRLHFARIFERTLDRETTQPLTVEVLAKKTSRVVKEFSELLAECCPSDFDELRLVTEGMEAIAAIERLVRAAESGLDRQERPATLRSVV